MALHVMLLCDLSISFVSLLHVLMLKHLIVLSCSVLIRHADSCERVQICRVGFLSLVVHSDDKCRTTESTSPVKKQ